MKPIYKLISLALLLAPAAAFSQSQTFSYTGTVQTFTVPANCFFITVDVMGAQGGTATNLSGANGNGGLGGRVQGGIAVMPGDVLNIYVGGVGTSDGLTLTCFVPAGGYNGGGDGRGGYNSLNYNAGGGGGASDIRLNGTALTDRIFVAGGGGGGCCSGCTGGGVDGGHGGGLNGQDGLNSSCCMNQNNGKGGTQSAGGAPGGWCSTVCTNATAGTLGMGGRGQDSAACSGGVTCGSGGGGGGGYYGGGGGGNGGGGGGSNYASVNATGVTHTQGYRSGDGEVIINYLTTSVLSPDMLDRTVQVYPNPASDDVTVKVFGPFVNAHLSVSNMLGEHVQTAIVNSAATVLDLSLLPAGIYFITVNLDGMTVTKKMVKK